MGSGTGNENGSKDCSVINANDLHLKNFYALLLAKFCFPIQ